MPRYALSVLGACRPLLWQGDWLARQLSFFDRWAVVLEAAAATDGTARVLEDVARRYPDRVRLEVAPARGWPAPLDALRAGAHGLRGEDEVAYLWLVYPGEVWAPDQLRAAEVYLRAAAAPAGRVGLRVRLPDGEPLDPPLQLPRLWRWRGELFAEAAEPRLAGQRGFVDIPACGDRWQGLPASYL